MDTKINGLSLREQQMLKMAVNDIQVPLGAYTLTVLLLSAWAMAMYATQAQFQGWNAVTFFYLAGIATGIVGLWLFFAIGTNYSNRGIEKPPASAENLQATLIFGCMCAYFGMGIIADRYEAQPAVLMLTVAILFGNFWWVHSRCNEYLQKHRRLKKSLAALINSHSYHLISGQLNETAFERTYDKEMYFLYLPYLGEGNTSIWYLLKRTPDAAPTFKVIYAPKQNGTKLGTFLHLPQIQGKIAVLPANVKTQRQGLWLMEQICKP